jgi:hypothetical protein
MYESDDSTGADGSLSTSRSNSPDSGFQASPQHTRSAALTGDHKAVCEAGINPKFRLWIPALRFPAHLWLAIGNGRSGSGDLEGTDGHSSITTTIRYFHPTPEHQAADKLERSTSNGCLPRLKIGTHYEVPTVTQIGKFPVLINCWRSSRGGMCERLKQAVLKTA